MTDPQADAEVRAWQFSLDAATLVSTLWMLVVGAVLVVIDLTIGVLDVIPDLLGYLILAWAGWRLRKQPADDFRVAQSLRLAGVLTTVTALLLALVWIAEFIGVIPATLAVNSAWTWVGTGSWLLSAAAMWAVFEGLFRWLNHYGFAAAARHSRVAGRLIAGVAVALVAFELLAYVLTRPAVVALALLAVLVVVGYVFGALSLLLTIRDIRRNRRVIPPQEAAATL